MKYLSRHMFVLYMVALSLLLLCLYAVSGSATAPPLPPTSAISHYFEHAKLIAYTADGSLNYRADIRQIRHDGDSQPAHLSDIKIHYLEPAAQTHLIADAGQIDRDQHTIYLHGEVEILSEEYGRESTQRSRVQTVDVIVDTVHRLAATSAAVSIHRDNQHLHGMGMHADLATGKLKIIEDVKVMRQ